jgi:ketosteroid isomerase-like protein
VGDLDAFLDAHVPEATVVVPPDGRTVHGHKQIRSAIAPLLDLRPQMTTVVVRKLAAAGLAPTHGRWCLAFTEDKCRTELSGLGTTVSRRGADGTWRIVLDDPLTGP